MLIRINRVTIIVLVFKINFRLWNFETTPAPYVAARLICSNKSGACAIKTHFSPPVNHFAKKKTGDVVDIRKINRTRIEN